MRLTSTVLLWATYLPKQHIYRGKYRVVKKVTPKHIAKKRQELEIEEENMFYLRHPFFTVEQDNGHAKVFNHREKFFAKHQDFRLKNWKNHKLLGDRFGFLKVAEKWD